MEFLFSAATVREADRRACSALEISGSTLMENAGRSLTSRVLKRYPNVHRPLILAGPGNNGGDGLVMARQFLISGRTPVVLLSRNPSSYRGETLENLKILQHLLGTLYSSPDLTDEEIDHKIEDCDLVIDCLLGTGSSGAPRGEILRLIRRIPSGIPVVAVDLPTGVDPDSGRIGGLSVHADFTATLLTSKPGLHVTPGANRTGPVEVCDIGIPPSAVLYPEEASAVLHHADDLSDHLPERPQDLHKGKRGNLLIVGGSDCFRGAMALACKGALRAGAGVVIAAVPYEIATGLASLVPEVVVYPIPSTQGYLPEDTLERCIAKWGRKRFSALVLGPGLGRTDQTASLSLRAWTHWEGPCILDADALYGLAKAGRDLKRRKDAVLTPHEGEAGTLLDRGSATVADNRRSAARELAERWGNILLKGQGTIIDNGHQQHILASGHPCLSVPGSGDVLSGAIGAFLASGMPTLDATLAGGLLHAAAGERLGFKLGVDGVLAREIPDMFPSILLQARHRTGTTNDQPRESRNEQELP